MRYINSIIQDKIIKKFSDSPHGWAITFNTYHTIAHNSDNISNIPDVSEWWGTINELSMRNWQPINVILHPICLTGKRKKIVRNDTNYLENLKW